MHTYNICVHIYLLVIAVVNLHLVTIFKFSHLCPLLCNCLYQRLNVWFICVLMGVCRCTWVAVHLNLYVKCGNHICSVIYIKYVIIAPCLIVDIIDFICGIYMCIHLLYILVKHLAFVPNNYINIITLM